MSDDQGRRRPGIGEGIRAGIGILSAFREAVEETFQEAVERGDLKPDRAKQAVQDVIKKVQDTAGDVRERLDVVPRREFDELREQVEALREEVAELRGRLGIVEGGLERGAGPDASGIITEPE
ncbi:MAG TPA: hypothetical protein VHG28_03335 [Longimicrobiaceae bacterium]|nr:hypothetical protein [Longimicrobiaceae bacterium]